MCSWNCSWFSVVNPLVHLEHVNLYFLQGLSDGSSVAASRPGGGERGRSP